MGEIALTTRASVLHVIFCDACTIHLEAYSNGLQMSSYGINAECHLYIQLSSDCMDTRY